MSVKKRVNAVLTRTTGYHLTRTSETKPSAAETRLIAAAKRLERAARKVERTVQSAKPAAPVVKPAPPAAPVVNPAPPAVPVVKPAPEVPADYDEEYREIITAVRPYTMTGNDKLHALITATRYIHRYQVPGAVVECGVWRGGSMHAVARTLDRLGDYSRDLYLYDTFEGMTEPTEKDRRVDGQPAAAILATSDKQRSSTWAYASLEDVQAGFADVPYPSERVHFIKGRIEDTVPAEVPDEIAILRLDTDWYESTAHEFEHLYPRLVSGGVLIIDDYGFWQGSRQATHEFLDRTGERLLLIRMNSGRVAVKP
jgi:O-methyltransferase